MDISSITPHSVQSIWISDTHLGFRGCQAELLLDFVRNNITGCLYHDLCLAALSALKLSRSKYRQQALEYTSEKASKKIPLQHAIDQCCLIGRHGMSDCTRKEASRILHGNV